MLNKPVVIFIALVIAIGGLGFGIYEKMNSPKLGYVRIKDVFEKFDMKKETQSKFLFETGITQHKVDSVAMELQKENDLLNSIEKPTQLQEQNFEKEKNEFLLQKRQFESDKQNLTDTYNTQIINRMNQYIHEYGKDNGYTFIYGDDGNGSLMYSIDELDLTSKIVEFINQQYAGEKK